MASSDKRIEVEFGAKTEEIEQGARRSADAVERFGKASDQAVGASEARWGALKPIFSDLSQQIDESGHSAQVAGGLLREFFVGVAAAASVGAIVEGLHGIIDAQDEISKGAQKMGISTKALSELAYVGQLADVEMGELQRTMVKLSTTLVEAKQGQEQASDLFRRLKLDAAGLGNVDDLLMALAQRFAEMDDGAAKTAISVELFGERVGPQLIPYLNQGREGIQQIREEADRLGLTVDDTGTKAEAFNDSFTRMKAATAGIGNQIVTGMLPAVSALVQNLADARTQGDAVGKSFGETLGAVIKTVSETILILGANVKFVLDGMGREIGAVAAQIAALARLDMSGFRAISDAVKEDGDRARAELDALEKRLMAVKVTGLGEDDPRELARRGRSVKGYGPGFEPLPPAVKTPKEKAHHEKQDAEQSAIPALMAQLDAQKLVFAETHDGREMSKAEELAYWQEVQRTADLTSKDQISVLRQTTSLQLGILRESTREKAQLDSDATKHAIDMALQGVDAQEQAAQQAYQNGQISQGELLGLEEQFEQSRFAIKLQGLRDRAALIDPDRDPVGYQQMLQQIELLEAQHQQTMVGIQQQMRVEQDASFRGMIGSMQAGLQSLGQSLLMHTFSWRSAFSQAWSSIAQSASSTIASIATNWVKGLLQMQSAKKSMTLASIHQDAMAAAAGAYKAIVGIPYVGPVLAPAAAAAAYAGAMVFASAEGGYDIPAGVNPMVQAHQKEMILPAKYADVIRGMAEGAGQGGGEGGGEMPNLVFNGIPMPGGFFMAHQDEFVRFYQTIKRQKYI